MNVRQNKQLVCDACKRIKQTNVIEDCKCGKGQMWVKSTNTMSNLKTKYKNIVEAYMDAFCEKQDMILESWVANDIGTIACFGDVMYFGFDDIRYDIDTKQPVGQILDWLYSSIDNPDAHINYRHWCKGLRYK